MKKMTPVITVLLGILAVVFAVLFLTGNSSNSALTNENAELTKSLDSVKADAAAAAEQAQAELTRVKDEAAAAAEQEEREAGMSVRK